MKGKPFHFNLKVEGIESRTATLLKQEMLSLGGDAGLDRRGLDCSVKYTDAILTGAKTVRKSCPQTGSIPWPSIFWPIFKVDPVVRFLLSSVLAVPETEQYDFHIMNWGPRFLSEVVDLRIVSE